MLFLAGEAEMACKFCGLNWKKDVSTEELKEELEQRVIVCAEEIRRQRVLARIAKEEYLARVWPRYRWLPLVGVLGCFSAMAAAIVFAIAVMSFGPQASSFSLLTTVPTLLGVELLFLSPIIYMLLKEARLVRDFKKKHPEHAEAL
ncbi:MAG: hypothetical protein Q7S52_01055 [bacterium]|nr:hypothetical protein [bacterium]